VLVDKADAVRALRAVHQAFGLHEPRPGAGLPGRPGQPTSFRRRPPEAVQEEPARDMAAITRQLSSMEDIVVSDVLLTTEQGGVTLFNLPDVPGTCSRVFQAVAAGGIVVDMIVLSAARGGRSELSFSVPRGDLAKAVTLTEAAARQIDAATRVTADDD